MMEFPLARVAMVICGAVILAAVLPPVTSAFDNEQSAELQEQTEMICKMLDTFYASEADEMVICLNTILPLNSSISMDGHLVTIMNDDQEFLGGTEVMMISDKEYYDGNDYVRITKGDSTIIIESLRTG